jgi:hypothetical protein
MKKLTKAQQEEQNKIELALIEKNAPLLFDIDSAIADGKRFKAELDELNRSNNAIIETQREKCLKDFKTLQTFLGEYKDLVEIVDEENSIQDQYFGFIVGKGLKSHPICFSYYFGRDWWSDSDNLQVIDCKEHQVYYPEDIDLWCETVRETETYQNIEQVFNDNDYSSQIEKLLKEYIIKN